MSSPLVDLNSTDIEEKLICMVQIHKCLYDLKDKDYKNNKTREAKWRLISEELGVDGKLNTSQFK